MYFVAIRGVGIRLEGEMSAVGYRSEKIGGIRSQAVSRHAKRCEPFEMCYFGI